MAFSPFQHPLLHLTDRRAVHRNPPGWNWRKTDLDCFNLWIAFEGQGIMSLNGRSFAISPGRSVLLFPGDSVFAEDLEKSGMKNVGMHFRVEAEARAHLDLDRLHNVSTQLRALGLAHELARRVASLPAEAEPEANSLALHLLLVFIRDWELGPEDPRDRIIRAQIERIKDRPYGTVSVDALAAEASLSLSQYRRRFFLLTQSTPNDFVIHQRIESACKLLRESNLSIEQIAEALGYRDTPFFSRQFKKKIGCNPTAYRQSMHQPPRDASEGAI